MSVALVVANREADGGTDGRGVADRLVVDIQADEHEMHPRDSHALAVAIVFGARVASWRGRVARPVRLRIVAGRMPLAPHRLAFLRLHGTPAVRQFSRRDEEIAAGFGFERLSGDPHVIPKCRVLEQVTIAFLPDDGGVMIYLQMHDGRHDECRVFLAEGHLEVEAELLR